MSAPAGAGAGRKSALPSLKTKAGRILRDVSERLEDVVPTMVASSGRKGADSVRETAEADARLALFMLIKCKMSLASGLREVAAAVHPGQPAEAAEAVAFLQGLLQLTLTAVQDLASAIKGAVLCSDVTAVCLESLCGRAASCNVACRAACGQRHWVCASNARVRASVRPTGAVVCTLMHAWLEIAGAMTRFPP